MDLSQRLTDELTDLRVQARENKDYRLSDEIRNELDSRGSFCMDGPDGQEVYHLGPGYTRAWLIANIKDVNDKFKYNGSNSRS